VQCVYPDCAIVNIDGSKECNIVWYAVMDVEHIVIVGVHYEFYFKVFQHGIYSPGVGSALRMVISIGARGCLSLSFWFLFCSAVLRWFCSSPVTTPLSIQPVVRVQLCELWP